MASSSSSFQYQHEEDSVMDLDFNLLQDEQTTDSGNNPINSSSSSTTCVKSHSSYAEVVTSSSEQDAVGDEDEGEGEGEENKKDKEDEDQALTERMALLSTNLLRLNLEAQEQLYAHRLSTQRTLSRETAELYKKYAQHGSMPRLSSSLFDFLSRGGGGGGSGDDDNVNIEHQQDGMTVDGADTTNTNTNTNTSSRSNPTTTNPHSKRPRYATSPSSTAIVASLGFHPADIKLTFPAYLSMPVAVSRSLNNILQLHNSIAQAKLRHHVAKYCLPFPCPSSGQKTGHGEAHPHILPLFRLAIAEPLQHRLSTMFIGQSMDTHPLGLTLESVKLLRQAYDSKSGAASDLEYLWLARALRVNENVVREWWREEDQARRAEKMMMVWVAAREWERRGWYKERGML